MLSVLGNPRRGSAREMHAQRVASSPSESFVPSRAQRAQFAKPDFTNSLSLQNLKHQGAFKTLKLA